MASLVLGRALGCAGSVALVQLSCLVALRHVDFSCPGSSEVFGPGAYSISATMMWRHLSS